MSQPRCSILVTGVNGQLGRELQDLAPQFPQYNFVFASRADLPIEDISAVDTFFGQHQFTHCINCAAYTAVDKAESEQEQAFATNALAVQHLAWVCRQLQITFIHLSTDYVFDGKAVVAYTERAATNPLGVYGASKLKAEQLALAMNPATIIIRTSWLYSRYGHNFVKTMLRLLQERPTLTVVNDQWGRPTHAADLAAAILQIIGAKQQPGGIYHYSNGGQPTTWYEFANLIHQHINSHCDLLPIPTNAYPTAAQRPAYSVLDTNKIALTFNLTIPDWQKSLEICLSLMDTDK